MAKPKFNISDPMRSQLMRMGFSEDLASHAISVSIDRQIGEWDRLTVEIIMTPDMRMKMVEDDPLKLPKTKPVKFPFPPPVPGRPKK